jgi:hypothetical protein
MRNTGACIPALVFLMSLHRQEQQCCRLPRLCAAERASAWKLGATGDLPQGPAIAIGIAKMDK